jgi:hypothetical protein
MTSDFGGIRHPKYRVKQDGEPERLLMTKNFGGINQPLYPVLNPNSKKSPIANSKGFHAPSRANKRAQTMKNLDNKKRQKQFRSSKGSKSVKSMINLPDQDSNLGGFN